MHFSVDVIARRLETGEEKLATHCVVVMVATDRDGKPTPVPKWLPESDDDKALAAYAQKLMELDKNIEQEIARYRDAAHLAWGHGQSP
jgi:acyl-CoA hydrolase